MSRYCLPCDVRTHAGVKDALSCLPPWWGYAGSSPLLLPKHAGNEDIADNAKGVFCLRLLGVSLDVVGALIVFIHAECFSSVWMFLVSQILGVTS